MSLLVLAWVSWGIVFPCDTTISSTAHRYSLCLASDFAEYTNLSLRVIHHSLLLSEAYFTGRAHARPLAELSWSWFRTNLWVCGSCRYSVGQSEGDAGSDIAPEEGCSLLEINLSSRKSLLKRWWMLLTPISQNKPEGQRKAKPMCGSFGACSGFREEYIYHRTSQNFSCSNGTLLQILYVTWSQVFQIR